MINVGTSGSHEPMPVDLLVPQAVELFRKPHHLGDSVYLGPPPKPNQLIRKLSVDNFSPEFYICDPELREAREGRALTQVLSIDELASGLQLCFQLLRRFVAKLTYQHTNQYHSPSRSTTETMAPTDIIFNPPISPRFPKTPPNSPACTSPESPRVYGSPQVGTIDRFEHAVEKLVQKIRLRLIALACILVCLLVIASSLIRMWYQTPATQLDEYFWGRTRRSFRALKLKLVTFCVGVVISTAILGMCLVLKAPIHISLLVRNSFSILSCFPNHSQGQAMVALIILGSALLSETPNHDQDHLEKISDLEKHDLQNGIMIKKYNLRLIDSQIEQPLYSETTPCLSGQMIEANNQQSRRIPALDGLNKRLVPFLWKHCPKGVWKTLQMPPNWFSENEGCFRNDIYQSVQELQPTHTFALQEIGYGHQQRREESELQEHPRTRSDYYSEAESITPPVDDVEWLKDVSDRIPRNTPYACTFSGCFKKFEETYAWKRHENSRHFQHECWICAFCPRKDKDGNGPVKTRLFYYRCAYITHLQSVHSADDGTVDRQCREQRIGRNNQSQFWCGFCGEIVQLQNKGLKGAEERFSHIERHFLSGERIANYIEMER